MTNVNGKYLPALGHHRLTPLYYPVQRWLMQESRLERRLLKQAGIQPGQRVLDLGCGTGTLSVLLKQSQPQAEAVALDADPKVLTIARTKAARASLGITFDQGLATHLPYPDRSFDCVLSSLMLHHLAKLQKERTLREAYRVLRPGGEIHVMDFGRPHVAYTRLVALLLIQFEQVADNIKGLLPETMHYAGFEEVNETAKFVTVVGSISFYQARRANRPPL